jgi:hypothetical protein
MDALRAEHKVMRLALAKIAIIFEEWNTDTDDAKGHAVRAMIDIHPHLMRVKYALNARTPAPALPKRRAR